MVDVCPRGGIGIHGRLRACVRMDVVVRVDSGASEEPGAILRALLLWGATTARRTYQRAQHVIGLAWICQDR